MRLAAFAPNGARIVATCDWIPARARIDPDSWRLTADGRLDVDFLDMEPTWDGVLTQTRGGYTVYLTAGASAVGEDDVAVYALDAHGEPHGAPLPFTPARTAPVFDEAFQHTAQNLAIAAEGVLDAWEGGDLAEAVRGLGHELAQLRAVLPAPALSPATAPDTPCNGDTP